jgi:CBS domain-containing protein
MAPRQEFRARERRLSIEEAIRTMQDHQVRRLPVIDGHKLVGVVSQADMARNYPEDRVGELVAFTSY